MSKSLIIGLLVVLLAGGGMAFAQYGSGYGLPGVRAELEADVDEMVTVFEIEESEELTANDTGSEENGDDNNDDENGDNTSDGNDSDEDGEDTSNDTDSSENGTDDEDDQRSEVATAVLEALSGDSGLMPGDEGFGQAVAEKAREGGLGEIVSQAAREANGSINANGKGNSGDKPGKAVGNPNR